MASPLPSIDALVRVAGCDAPHRLVVEAARAVIGEQRAAGAQATAAELAPRVRERVAEAVAPSLQRVLNATGVVLHTNLGRAPLAEPALAAVLDVARGYANLEIDETGRRGSRQAHVVPLVCELTGAEDALCVNNCAAALVLALAALAAGREVIVSRGQLVEIGDGFRIPEIIASAGATLREVGATNRARASDFARAITPETAALLRVHPSNYRIVGFSEEPELGELAELADERSLPLIDDLGSGAMLASPVFGDEPTARGSLAAGAGLVCISGDKLLGGPQAGIIAGRRDLVERCRRHPLARALRIDKLSLAALEATLALLRDPARALHEIPSLRAMHEDVDLVERRAMRLVERVGGSVVPTTARVGGGALPLAEIASFGVALPGPAEREAAALRAQRPAVIARIVDGRCILDCRTLTDDEIELIARR